MASISRRYLLTVWQTIHAFVKEYGRTPKRIELENFFPSGAVHNALVRLKELKLLVMPSHKPMVLTGARSEWLEGDWQPDSTTSPTPAVQSSPRVLPRPKVTEVPSDDGGRPRLVFEYDFTEITRDCDRAAKAVQRFAAEINTLHPIAQKMLAESMKNVRFVCENETVLQPAHSDESTGVVESEPRKDEPAPAKSTKQKAKPPEAADSPEPTETGSYKYAPYYAITTGKVTLRTYTLDKRDDAEKDFTRENSKCALVYFSETGERKVLKTKSSFTGSGNRTPRKPKKAQDEEE